MKYLLALLGLTVMFPAYADVITIERNLVQIQVRSGDYYASSWNDGVTLLVAPGVAISGCNDERVYFNAKVDSGMLTTVLAAQSQGKKVKLLVSNDRSKDGLCKVEMASISQ